MTMATTIATTKFTPPIRAPNPISKAPEERAENEEKISGAPFPKAKNVTPEISGES